ncbi:MAG: SIS domain-containing protein [Aestuariivirga sp.]|uniref:SIS domain-containing protein n=1 Tax=Aestuariivirga sp. TaxID=2650926 RepID=UPI0025C2D36F|nr:SIS domain-containing protein [Aestuariivirga sp.]MCA3561129.1 SIS domain-containing protein [Aestuariivirga sp.]
MSLMAAEAAEAAQSVARFLDFNGRALAELGDRLRGASPPVVLTCARGSSDNAAAYFKYLCEIMTGVPCASVGASVVSVYGGRLKAEGALCLTISQSGQSPDIVALQRSAKQAGALTVALVNVEDSPAARNADICLALHAGEEKSVAATKSFIVSCAAAAAIVAQWSGDAALLAAVERLPRSLDAAVRIAWPGFTSFARDAVSLFVLGRGPAYPIAQETALKLKETCAIHAEAYSVAEVMHGPWELMGADFPVLIYAPDDAARANTREAAARMRGTGADVKVVGEALPFAATGHPLLDPISMIATAYLQIERVAVTLGRDPDRPRLLKKVTETL